MEVSASSFRTPLAGSLSSIATVSSSIIIHLRIQDPVKNLNLPTLYSFVDDNSYARKYKFHDFVADLVRDYGPITRFDLFGSRSILVLDAETNKRILTNSTEFGRGTLLQDMFHGLLHYALFVLPAGNTWKRHRKGLQPAFGPANIRQTFQVANKVMDKVYEILDTQLNDAKNKKDRLVLNMHKVFSVIALDVM
jgi:cytochrome P450